MAIEIERKYLVRNDGWQCAAAEGRHFEQFYLTSASPASVRVRIEDGQRAWLTVKSGAGGISRNEFEYAIPVADALAMLPLAVGTKIAKVRFDVPNSGHRWEVDVFSADNEGLVIAEIELHSVDEQFEIPSWVGPEVTHDRRYYSASLAQRPFKTWPAP